MVRTACSSPDWHRGFLGMLPAILSYVRFAFRHLRPEARAEAIQEVVANCFRAYARLVELHKADIAYPTPLARYGIRQFRDGRLTGGHLNCKDISSRYCQRLKKVVVERLDHFDEEEGQWQEAVVQDTRSSPVSEIVGFRVDFADWLKSLSYRDRRIAQFLSLGNRTRDAAQKFDVSEGRVSQLRRELAESWKEFTGESDESDGNAAA